MNKKILLSLCLSAAVFAGSCSKEEDIFGVNIIPDILEMTVGEEVQLQLQVYIRRDDHHTAYPSYPDTKLARWESATPSVARVSEDGKLSALSEGTAVILASYHDVACFSPCSLAVHKHPEPAPMTAVDLGLSVKWAAWNLGANSPEERGNRYAWGETWPKWWKGYVNKYNDYKWGFESSYTKYGSEDQKTEFKDYDYADDAARLMLGGKWRIPTAQEWEELINECNFRVVNGTGRFSSKKPGYTGNAIILPLETPSTHTAYWSSTLYDGVAMGIDILSYTETVQLLDYGRNNVFMVRAVTD